MEQGAKSLLRILVIALLIGAGVIAVKPAYRQALMALVHGQPLESPIWKSNEAYYPDITMAEAATAGADAPASASDVP